MEPVFIIENLQLEWRNESNLSDNMRNIVQEFKNAWNLQPLKIIIHGPPASGKTTLSKMICERYNLHYVSLDTVIKETLEELRAKLAYVQQNVKEVDIELGEEEGEEEEDDDYVVDVEAIEEQIKELTSADNGQMLEKYIKSFLEKNLCQNQGYVLDDYPRTFSQANQLFGANSDGVEEEEAVGEATKILPTHVLSLEAPDEWLCERVMRLPEVNVQGTPYHEDKMMERLSKFRSDNTEDDTVLNFFDNMEIHPILIDVRQNFHCIFSCICEQLGEPVGFGLTVEEEMELLELEKAEMKLNEERKEVEKQRLEEEITLKRHEKMEKWSETLQALQREEEKILIAQSEPLRTYLIKYIFPVLTNGLLEIVKIRPEDPVDYLAEYLFRENPEGRMFDPSYTRDGEKLLKDVEKTLKN